MLRDLPLLSGYQSDPGQVSSRSGYHFQLYPLVQIWALLAPKNKTKKQAGHKDNVKLKEELSESTSMSHHSGFTLG